MQSIEFINNYKTIIEELRIVSKPIYYPAIDKLKNTDPHDLISPDSVFLNYAHMYGFVLLMMLKEFRQTN